MKDENKEICDELEEKLSNEEKELRLAYLSQFLKDDKANAVYYCKKWTNNNERKFRAIEPEDLVFKVLEGIYEGKICYTKSYKHFKGSVYFHLKFALLSHFKIKKKDDLTEDEPENLFTEEYAENFFESEGYFDGAEIILGAIENDEIREAIFSVFDPNVDIEELFVLEEIFKGDKRKEIADSLGMTEKELDVIRKRVFRRIEKKLPKNFREGIQP